MLRTALSLCILACLWSTAPAQAQSCVQIRVWVAQYGIAYVMQKAREMGLSKEQIAAGRACLREARKQRNVVSR